MPEMKTGDSTIAILMATYNGERFLSEQIESILAQSCQDWVLFIRDDGSADGTLAIIDRYCYAYPGQIKKLVLPAEKQGSTFNFAALHKYVRDNYSFSYYMFSDQDDVWLKDKIELTLRAMKKAENGGGPTLVHTDLKVVDENLNVLGESFFKYRALKPEIKDINHLLVQNNATGCTMMWNKALDDIVGDTLLAEGVFQHDWWLTLTACCFGKIVLVSVATVLYRQHGGNTIGATKVNSFRFIVKRMYNLDHVKRSLSGSVHQSAAFLSIYKNELTSVKADIIKEYSFLLQKNKAGKMKCILSNRFYKQGILQILGELVFF